MNGLVAVVIPAFRCEEAIVETLDSINAQHRKADYVVAVLDEPNPDLEAIFRAHEINVEIIVNPRNLGVAATRNIGFQHVKDRAEFVCFLDGDDVLHPDFFSIACTQYESRPDVDAVFGSFILWHDGTPKEPLPRPTAESLYQQRDVLNFYWSNTGKFLLSFALFRISSVEAVSVDGKVNIECLRNNQDFEFISRLFYQGTIIRIGDPCGWHRKLPNSLSSDQVRAWHFRSVAASILYKWLDEHHADKALLNRVTYLGHSAIRGTARLLWARGERKQATQILLKSIAKLQFKSVAQLGTLYLGIDSRLPQRKKT